VDTIDPSDQNVGQFLETHPDVYHVIAGLSADRQTGAKAHVYTQGQERPSTFRAESTRILVSRIRTHLKSRKVVNRRAEQPSKDSFVEHINLGLQCLDKKQLHKAITEFEKAAKIKSKRPLPYYNMALCYKQLGDQENRAAMVTKGLEFGPTNDELLNERALLYMMERDFLQAEETLREADQDNPTIQFNLAYSYRQLGYQDKEKDAMHKVVELQGNPHLEMLAEHRLRQLKEKDRELKEKDSQLEQTVSEMDATSEWAESVRWGLWIALGGLGCVAISGVIILLVRGTGRKLTATPTLKPEDRLALKVQIGMTVVSGLFGILTVVLTGLLSR
jgi:tetratricopeptide (TPR) repeat protein